jgi:cytoskeleton protein RodZ
MAGERPGDFGAKLRDARERKGVSLREIANRTKISVAVLEALERNEIARLPGGIFSRAFVRAYASEVGLDPETTIQDFVAQFPHDSVVAGHSSSDPIEDNVALESERRVASTVLWMFLICVPLAGVVLYLSTVNRAIPIDTAPAPAATTPASASPAAAPASDMKPPDVKPPAAPTSAPSVPPVEATAGSTPPRAASPTASESTVPAPTAMTAPSKPAPAPADASPAADRLVVGFAARRPVYVSVTADGRTVISRLLQPGERTRVEIVRDLTLTAGDASALSMTLNGAEARALGKAGEVVTTRVTIANFKDYLQTR